MTCASICTTGPAGQVLFPNGKFIGEDQYAALIASRFNMSVTSLKRASRHDITIRRLQAYVTAGVTVSDKEVARELSQEGDIKIKFDYAVISSDDMRKTINPSDSELEAFFKKNAARYAHAVPEERKITYFAFTPNEVPGGVQQPTQQEIQAVLQRAPERVLGSGAGQVAPYPDQVRLARTPRPMRRRRPRPKAF